jgi:phosphoglycerol transferase
MKEKRNVIVIFAESFELKHSVVSIGNKTFKVNDDGAVKFSNYIEANGVSNTFMGLYSALNGVCLKNLCVKQYAYNNYQNKDDVIDFSKVGVGNVLAHNGYKNLFVKGGSIDFMNTKEALLEQGFNEQDIYGLHSFSWWEEFEKTLSDKWIGPKDEDVFDLFKQKIIDINNEQPFFAVMFTLDWHLEDVPGLNNPFFDNDEDIKKSTISNFNDFIAWFEKQDFYDNTTLLIIADHKKMGVGSLRDEKLYNAFFNLPERLKNNFNVNKTINQLDMAPSILEIAGVELPDRQYGLGYSIFSKDNVVVKK